MGTKFTEIYNCFLGKITDDMYFELTPQDTLKDLQNLLINAIPEFEFPRVILDEYTVDQTQKLEEDTTPNDFIVGFIWNELETDELSDTAGSQMAIVDNSYFKYDLTKEEINILATIMMCA